MNPAGGGDENTSTGNTKPQLYAGWYTVGGAFNPINNY
jgi:hypothetical protein